MGKRFEWTELGSAVMKAARKRKGLSYEGTARLLNVSAKTYERYEKSGMVPKHDVAKIANVLGLEVEQSEPVRITLRPEDEALAQSVDRRLRRIEEALGIAPLGEDVGPAGEAANGH